MADTIDAPIDLTVKEIHIILMALRNIKESVDQLPVTFNEQARLLAEDITHTAQSAIDKLEAATGLSSAMPPYKEGDENEFINQS